ncbi:S-layer homology domain-containing protein, partial [Fusibacter paucivorans]
ENVVVVPITNKTANKVNTNLTGDIVKNMENNQFKLTIQTNNVDYILPAKEVQISNIASALNVNEAALKDIMVSVTIDKLDSAASEAIVREAENQNLEVVFPPVSFKVEATAQTATGEKQTVEISRFSGYVERRIALPEGIDPSKVTTGVVYNEDGTFSHIPTRVILIDGIYYAELSSITNSSYSVVYHPIEVSSAKGHWAEKAINNMASRMVIADPETFEPDALATRGAFIDYIVRAMGLYRNGAADMTLYPDMSMAYADSVTIAKTYGIANGYEDGTIRDMAALTREEAMVMLAQALDVFEMLETSPTIESEMFVDLNEVSAWASSDASRIVNAKIMNGIGNQQLDPKGNYTYAQAAATIENMLKSIGL